MSPKKKKNLPSSRASTSAGSRVLPFVYLRKDPNLTARLFATQQIARRGYGESKVGSETKL